MVGLPSLSVDSNSSEPVHLYYWFPDRVGGCCIMVADGLLGWQTCRMCGVPTACLYTEILLGVFAIRMDSHNSLGHPPPYSVFLAGALQRSGCCAGLECCCPH